MKYSDASCRHVAELLIASLCEKTLVRLAPEKRTAAVGKVTAALLDNFRQEEAIEQEAERLAEEHLRKAPLGMDRHRVVQMIKQRLAEEKRFSL
jgi:hypothetical protein